MYVCISKYTFIDLQSKYTHNEKQVKKKKNKPEMLLLTFLKWDSVTMRDDLLTKIDRY